eukprot:gene5956-9955_t
MKRKLDVIEQKTPEKTEETNLIKKKLLIEITNPSFGNIKVQTNNKDINYYINSGILNSFSESEVFEKMFKNGMQETDSKIWDLTNYKPNLIQELILSFFNIISINDENVNFFLEMGHLYEFKFLLNESENYLIEKNEKSLDIALLSKNYNLSRLWDDQFDFLVENYENICHEENFKLLEFELQTQIVNNKIEKLKNELNGVTSQKHHYLYKLKSFHDDFLSPEHTYCLDCEKFVLLRKKCYHNIPMKIEREKTLLPFCHKCGNCLSCQDEKCSEMTLF